jgi:hypothetical protein
MAHGFDEIAATHKANEVGAEVLLAISREFGKSLEWLLTGEEESARHRDQSSAQLPRPTNKRRSLSPEKKGHASNRGP